MIYPYQLDREYLDFGDIGKIPVIVDGTVEVSGLKSLLYGYRKVELMRVMALIPGHPAHVDVTRLIGRPAQVELEEAIEMKFDADIAGMGTG